MPPLRLTATLIKPEPYPHTCLFFPSAGLGTTARLRVKGTINGHAFATSAFPTGDGRHMILLNAEMRRRMGVAAGDTVVVELEADTAPPPAVEVPDDFAAALDNNPDARAAFDKMARSHRRRYVDWIEEAKRPETRAQRIQRAVEMILGNTNARSARQS